MEIDQQFSAIFKDIYEPDARQSIVEHSHIVELKPGDTLMEIGGYIKYIPFVLEGLLKIMREDKDGHELLLYYVQPGETCAMSLTCCTGDARSSVKAVAEEETTLLAFPVKYMDQWTTDYKSFKSFVMLTYQRRFDELLQTVDAIAFHSLDDRLIHALKEKQKSQGSNTLSVTHQEIANELNSSREVISRLLKRMEKDGKIEMGRNKLTIKHL